MADKVTIRPAQSGDLSAIMAVYAYAQEAMRRNGNPHQWGDWYPKQKLVEKDIALKRNYVFVDEQGVCGVFVFIVGADPTYERIDAGAWLNDRPYGTIHRIASNGRCQGLMRRAVDFCAKIEPNIRIDTHEDNAIMRHLVAKCGFTYCGIIHTYDGTPRLAFQREKG